MGPGRPPEAPKRQHGGPALSCALPPSPAQTSSLGFCSWFCFCFWLFGFMFVFVFVFCVCCLFLFLSANLKPPNSELNALSLNVFQHNRKCELIEYPEHPAPSSRDTVAASRRPDPSEFSPKSRQVLSKSSPNHFLLRSSSPRPSLKGTTTWVGSSPKDGGGGASPEASSII